MKCTEPGMKTTAIISIRGRKGNRWCVDGYLRGCTYFTRDVKTRFDAERIASNWTNKGIIPKEAGSSCRAISSGELGQ